MLFRNGYGARDRTGNGCQYTTQYSNTIIEAADQPPGKTPMSIPETHKKIINHSSRVCTDYFPLAACCFLQTVSQLTVSSLPERSV